jgi:MerR family transcriptional regulator, light-induced transcriptional regulator
MIKYSIKDLERISGVKAHTLRIWEKRYEIITPNRTDTNIRYYSTDELKKLVNITILNRAGYKISKIARMDIEALNQKVVEVSRELNINDQIIDNLILSMVDFDESLFEKTFSKSLIKKGFEDTFEETIFPFLRKVVLLWQTNAISSVHKGFINNLIRKKLIVGLDSIDKEPLPGSKKFVLYLPTDERNEIELLYYSYVIKRNGHQVKFLGQDILLEDLIEYIKKGSTDYLLTSYTVAIFSDDFEEYFRAIYKECNKIPIFVSGIKIDEYDSPIPDNVKKLDNPKQLKKILEESINNK